MADRELIQSEREQLEALIDATDLAAVLMALSEICGEKAEHIRSNWQDERTARCWDSAAGVIGCIVSNRHVHTVSHY